MRLLLAAFIFVGLLSGCVAHSPFHAGDRAGGDQQLIEARWQAGCDPQVYERTPRGAVRMLCK
jgi:hypothetical protein